ncbi:MAG: tRNA (adenosine(37)-N6)-threonylcarbamoyltransferase complex dimerization subunit type 1 TsaB [Clostridia bacterium]|nr:tRNA (adenosine(37)-N6)-threonylcarbamoyltransferase complex dimerization subunit type 1 TsaB [Clostridia bacterium]
MKAAIIDSTATELLLIVIKDQEEYVYVGNKGARRHTSEILTELDKLFTDAGISARELNYVGVVVGAGSFTGIRIGVATANAMAYASGAKIVELTEMEALIIDEERALALIDCKHNNYYAMVKDDGVREYLAISGEEADKYDLKKVYYTAPEPQKVIKTFLEKVNRGEFSAVAKPFYLKKSSAEA